MKQIRWISIFNTKFPPSLGNSYYYFFNLPYILYYMVNYLDAVMASKYTTR